MTTNTTAQPPSEVTTPLPLPQQRELPLTEIFTSEKDMLRYLHEYSSKELHQQLAALSGDELDRFESQACKRLKLTRGKNLYTRVLAGSIIAACHAAYTGSPGGFKRFLRKAGIDRRRAYEWEDLAALFGGVCAESPQIMQRFHIESANLLARKSTPKHIQQRFLSEARSGKDVTTARVQFAIAETSDKPSTSRGPRLRDLYKNKEVGIEIRTTLKREATREQVVAAFKAALNETVSKLSPEETA